MSDATTQTAQLADDDEASRKGPQLAQEEVQQGGAPSTSVPDGPQTVDRPGVDDRQEMEKGQGRKRKRGKEAAPLALQRFSERVQRWSESVEAWSARQQEKSAQRRQGMRDPATEVDPATGEVKEPKGDNIVQRKGIIIIVAVVLLWVYFAFTWRVCAVNIKQERFRTTASRATGSKCSCFPSFPLLVSYLNPASAVGLLVGFNILWLMTIWTYVKVILTGPGLVRDHVNISDAPPAREGDEGMPDFEAPGMPKGTGAHPDRAPSFIPPPPSLPPSGPQLPTSPPPDSGAEPTRPLNGHVEASSPTMTEVDTTGAAVAGPLAAGLLASKDESEKVQQKPGQGQGREADDSGVGSSEQTRTMQPPQPPVAPALNPAPMPMPPGQLPEPVRMVPRTAPLDPANRYCYRCKRTKPPRAHHCRHCATCVLKMDHHCPWVGGCVGARNHKFFYNFLTWVTLLEIYTMISTAVLFSRGIQQGQERWHLDGYMISLFPITALFTLFTSLLLGTHTYLFLLNLTTIEHMAYDRMKTREDVVLSRYVDSQSGNGAKGKLGFAAQIKEKKRIRTKWAKEWGSLKTEGNLWWLDGINDAKAVQSDEKEAALFAAREKPEADAQRSSSTYARIIPWYRAVGPNWRQVMGQRPYEWFLPVGRSSSDGLSYPTNWRFGPGGTWRRRPEW